MLFSGKEDLTRHLQGIIGLSNGALVQLENEDKLIGTPLDILVKNSVLNENKEVRGHCRYIIKSVAQLLGIVPASIQGLCRMQPSAAFIATKWRYILVPAWHSGFPIYNPLRD